MKTFLKNLFVLLSAVFLAIIGALLMHIKAAMIVDGMTLVVPTIIAALTIEDLWRKLLENRALLTWQYFFGDLLVAASVLCWFWASTSISVKQMIIRLAVTFLSGVLGYLWFRFGYAPSIQTAEDKEEQRWERYRRKIIEEYDRDDRFRMVSAVLRFRVLSDNLRGDLDFNRPIGIYQEQALTYEELLSAEDDGTGSLPVIQAAAHEYLAKLVDALPE